MILTNWRSPSSSALVWDRARAFASNPISGLIITRAGGRSSPRLLRGWLIGFHVCALDAGPRVGGSAAERQVPDARCAAPEHGRSSGSTPSVRDATSRKQMSSAHPKEPILLAALAATHRTAAHRSTYFAASKYRGMPRMMLKGKVTASAMVKYMLGRASGIA